MPTVTAIALENLLEPGSSSASAPLHHPCSRTAGVGSKPTPSPSDSPATKGSRRRPCATTISTSSPKAHPHRHNEQQPVFLSRRPQQKQHPPSPAAAGSERNARRNGVQNERAPPARGARAHPSTRGYYIFPKLYATPESTRIVPTGSARSSSPTSDLCTSPYVVNHKRRGISRPSPPLPATPAADDGSDVERDADVKARPPDHGSGNSAGDEVGGGGGQGWEGSAETEEHRKAFNTQRNGDALDEQKLPDADAHNEEEEEEDFLDPRELMSAVSSGDTEDGRSCCRTPSGMYHTPLSNQGEFYDASEDFFSDGSVSNLSSSFRAKIEADLSSIRLDLSEETDKRVKVEDALTLMKKMLLRIASELYQSAVSLPPMQFGGELQYDMDSIAQICQEVVVTRIVFEAVEVGLAHAEAHVAAEAVIEAKNHEIARLQGRLQYYEAMNREMSQRNQEAIELARFRRMKRKMWQKWVWGCVGVSITMGAYILAYSHVPHASSEQHDASLETIEYKGSRT